MTTSVEVRMTVVSRVESAGRLVGADHDAHGIVISALEGTSVLVAGPMGSGKSHLLRTVVNVLSRIKVTPLFLRPGRPISEIPLAALDSWPADRVALLREPDASTDERLLLVIDDVQDLDPESADVITQAIYRRRAVAVVGLQTPRARSQPAADGGSVSLFADLWLRGLADRVDLREMTRREAEELLRLFPGTEALDTVTRATVVSLADGSRILLRELAAHAVAAQRSGADALSALDGVPLHSRLGDALAAHVAALCEHDRIALAVLGRLDHVEYADAIRLIPSTTVSGLVAAGLVYEDASVRRRLVANRGLAREAAHQLERGHLDRVLDDAFARMLADSSGWWSEPVAAAIAARWHESPSIPAYLDEVPADVRVAVARAGAQYANDTGRPALAAAYAVLPTGNAQAPSLIVESMNAGRLLEGSGGGARQVEIASLDETSLRRHLVLRDHLVSGPDQVALERLARTRAIEESTAGEIDMVTAGGAVLRMDWAGAEAAASRAAHRSQAHSATRLRARLLQLWCRTELGDAAGAAEVLRRIDTMMREPGSALHLGAADRLLVLCSEIFVAQKSGRTVAHVRDRLHTATIAAAVEDSALAKVLAGLTAAQMHAAAGEGAAAAAELDAAVSRAAHLPLGRHGELVQLSVARSIAPFGRAQQARVAFERVSAADLGSSRLLQHDLALTESCILVAESRFDDALAPARAASELSAAARSPLAQLRDMYQLAALGAADEVMVRRMRRIADATDLSTAHVLVDHAAAIVRGRRSMSRRTPLELLRLIERLTDPDDAPLPAGTGSFLGPPSQDAAPPTESPLGLTPREQEVATLVAAGLGNREIAQRLFLSVRTVESHVYQARAKLGASSRTELGRVVGRLTSREKDGSVGVP